MFKRRAFGLRYSRERLRSRSYRRQFLQERGYFLSALRELRNLTPGLIFCVTPKNSVLPHGDVRQHYEHILYSDVFCRSQISRFQFSIWRARRNRSPAACDDDKDRSVTPLRTRNSPSTRLVSTRKPGYRKRAHVNPRIARCCNDVQVF